MVYRNPNLNTGSVVGGRSVTDKTKKFIQKAILIHGDRYDYSKIKYTKAIEKVVIICHKHGKFSQQPSDHLKGRGCRACGFERVTTENFIKNSEKRHGDRYDYTKSEFIKSLIRTTVTCKIHGDFKITPNKHQNGQGCLACSKLARTGGESTKAKTARDTFLKKAMLVHGDKIDFSKMNYITAKEKAIFICPTHGEWTARPDNILHGKGCPGCRAEIVREAGRQLSLVAAQKFADKARKVHGNKYDYSNTEYTTVHKKINILCPEHGEFWQSPANHLSGENGCPDCSIFGYRTSKSGWLYLQSLNDEFIKIGITNHTPERRMKEHKKNSKLSHKIVGKWFFDDGNIPLAIETNIKRSFKCGVVSPDVMEDGHSETMHIKELPDVLTMIHKMINGKINI